MAALWRDTRLSWQILELAYRGEVAGGAIVRVLILRSGQLLQDDSRELPGLLLH